MKYKNTIQKSYLAILSIIIALVFSSTISCTGQKTNQEVLQAWELRINGHADSAKVLLIEITAKNPENALAWFELCRSTEHIGLSNPRAIKETLADALEYISKATDLDANNAMYHSYKGNIETLQFYLSLKMGDKNATELLLKIEETYKTVLQIDPSYYENKLTLVEFFAGLPIEMGGNLEKAEKYAHELEKEDLIYGAKAQEILMSEDADYVAFWKEIIEKLPDNADAYQALGRVYLLEEKFADAEKQYQKAMALNPEKNILYLDLGRYFVMQAMQNQAPLDSVAPLAEKQFMKFLNLEPKAPNPMNAWTYGMLVMINRRLGNKDLAEKYNNKATELDPFFSPAFGKPNSGLYTSPEKIIHEQNYYLSPF